MKTIKQTIIWYLAMFTTIVSSSAVLAAGSQLQKVLVNPAGNKTEVKLDFNSPVKIPKGFVLENPPRIVFDLPKVEVLPTARRNNAGHGAVKSIYSASNKGQARIVFALKNFVNYSVEARGDDLVMIFDAPGHTKAVAQKVKSSQPVSAAPTVNTTPALQPTDTYKWYRDPSSGKTVSAPKVPSRVAQPRPTPKPVHKPVPREPVKHVVQKPVHQPRTNVNLANVPPPVSVAQPAPRPLAQHVRPQAAQRQPQQQMMANRAQPRRYNQGAVSANSLRSVDFRRNANGGGRLIIILPNGNAKISDDKRANTLHLILHDVDVPTNWQKRLDVLDFATPVSNILISQRGGNGRITVNANQNFNYRTERERNIYTVHIDKISQAEKNKKLKLGEKKKKEFKGEKLSLNFQDIEVRAVLQLLADFTNKNIVVSDSVDGSITVRLKDVPWDQALDIVLESKNLGMRENGNVIWVAPNAELEAKEAKELELAKRKIELEPLITEYIPINFAKAAQLMELIQKRSASGNDDGHSLLSPRGSVSHDERTNTLLVKDTAAQVEQIRDLIKVLDVPVQQVLIESRIVIANDEFGKELGTKFGVSPRWMNSDSTGLGAGTINASDAYNNSIADIRSSGDGQVSLPGVNDRLNVNLPVVGAAGSFGFSILTSDFMLDLELSALQAESKGEIIATPRVITSNQTKALIEQGVEIPYQQASSSGATNVAFKKAVLSLEVTPQITPDEHISMDLRVNQDTVGQIYANVPSIDTREIQTKVLVENGQTIVLGGVHEENSINGTTKVPVLGDLPVVGQLFRKTNKSENRRELLIFVTPKIVDSNGEKVAGR